MRGCRAKGVFFSLRVQKAWGKNSKVSDFLTPLQTMHAIVG